MRKILAIISFLILLACTCSDTVEQSSRVQESQDKPAEPANPEPAPATIGQDLTIGQVRWKVLEAKDLGQELKAEFLEPKTTSGKFILVRFEVENQKSEALTYAGIELVDNKDRTFDNYSEQFGFIPDGESCVLEQLNPNISRTCSEIFEVPADAAGLRAKLGDLELFGGEEIQVDLGF